MSIEWITAQDIEAWAIKEPRRAQEALPRINRMEEHHGSYIQIK